MAEKRQVTWFQIDEVIADLGTDEVHEIEVQREAIPLIFVPGIMGTRLRKAGTDGTGKDSDGVPNMRWDPSDAGWMFSNFSGKEGAERKKLLVGDSFSPDLLEVANDDPVGDGFSGIMADYWKDYLKPLKERNWGDLGKIFEFPVYAVGYNWTDSNENSGKKLAARIQDIIDEAKGVTGLCEKAILITHSMGGLVARWASAIEGAEGSLLGVIHGVQPVTGAPAAYWRMKAGFEAQALFDIKGKITSRILGNCGPQVTPVLGNLPGGLQLLPNKDHLTNDGASGWLTVTGGDGDPLILPASDPYDEIYRHKAIVTPDPDEKPSTNEYWGLVDPDLLDPGNAAAPGAAKPGPNAIDADTPPAGDPWDQYLSLLQVAETFHETLGKQLHPNTFCFAGIGSDTADVIELRITSAWGKRTSYPTRGFRGYLTNAKGKLRKAVLQDPDGDGDATVPRSSAQALNDSSRPFPGDSTFEVQHQPAYEDGPLNRDGTVQKYTVDAITSLCDTQYKARRGSSADAEQEPAPAAR